MVLTCLPFFIGFAHIVPYARDAGLDAATASLGLGAIGAGSIFGRIVLGPLADHFGRRQAYALTMVAIAVLMVWWLALPVARVWPLLLFGFAFGITFGGFSALCPVLMADYFGTSYVSGTIGVFYTGAAFGSLAGPWLAGVLYDRTGSYQPAILVGALAATLAAAVVLRIRDAAPAKAAFAAARQAEETRRLDPPGELPAGGSIGITTVGREQ